MYQPPTQQQHQQILEIESQFASRNQVEKFKPI